MDETVELLSRLVELDSVNPALVPGGAGETAIASFVEAWATGCGLSVRRYEAVAGRPSVVVRAPGAGGGRTLLLCGHLDTVGVGGMTGAPFAARVEGDRLYGRGAYDMKAGLAAALLACRAAASLPLAGDVVVACVADEEHASLGVQEVLRDVRADGAIVTEPTGGELIVAHKGFVWSQLTFRGRAAHGSRPDEGVDAIVAAGPALVRLAELDAGLPAHALLGRGSVHASLIRGGVELSSYPGECVLSVERRTLPGETVAQVERELLALIGTADASAETLLAREPFAIDPDHAFVRLVRRVAGDAPVAGAAYWTDAAFIAAAGIPTVLYGPGGEGAHADVEWVSLRDTAAVANTLVAVAQEFCA